MKIPFFSVARTVERYRAELDTALAKLDSSALVDGPLTDMLERRLEQYTGAAYCVAVGSATDALALVLRATGVGPGDEVIVPAYTFFATASTVVHVGATPVIVDVDPDSYAIDPRQVEAAITPRTRAIMPAHMFSQMARMQELCEIADRHRLMMIEDSAEAIGMRFGGRHAGLWGRVGVLSFFPTKTLGAFGDAGAVITDDAELADRVRRLARDDGSGWASSCDDLAAAVLGFRLGHLDEEITVRAALAERYSTMLAGLSPVRTPRPPTDHDPVWYVYLIECDQRDDLVRHLAERGVETEVYYPRPLTEQPCFDATNSVRHPVPVSARASGRALALPLHADLTQAEVDLVCAHIREFYGGRDA